MKVENKSKPETESRNGILVEGKRLVQGGQARQEPQWDPGKHSRGAPKHFHGASLWKNFWILLFKMVHSGVLYISGWRRGPPNVARPGVAYPLYPTLSTGLKVELRKQTLSLKMHVVSIISLVLLHTFIMHCICKAKQRATFGFGKHGPLAPLNPPTLANPGCRVALVAKFLPVHKTCFIAHIFVTNSNSVHAINFCLHNNLTIAVIQTEKLIYTEFLRSKMAASVKSVGLFGQTPQIYLRPAMQAMN